VKIFDTQPKPGAPVRSKSFFTAFLRMARAWEMLKVHNGHVSWSNGMPTIVVDSVEESGGATPYSEWAFGFSVDGAVVTVNAGKVRHGTRTPISVAGADITITADHTWIWPAYTYGGGAATLTSGLTEPQDTATAHNRALHQWRLIDGVASLEKICHLGDIWLPSNMG